MSDDDLEEQMNSVSERAKKMGVSGAGSSDPSELETTESESESATSSSSQQDETTSEPSPGGISDHEYPNPDKDLGALSDVYEKTNVFLSPEVLDAVSELWDDIEYEWKKTHDSELEKNWDFYMACFRVLLQNEDLLREELGMEPQSED